MSAPTHNSYDLIVAGAGPAGCAAAIMAKRTAPAASVLLVEKGSYPRHKVCGEFVSPEALELLRSLLNGHGGPAIDTAPRIGSARLFFKRTPVEVAIEPAALSVSRHALDALLWSAARSVGVECRSNTAVQHVQRQGSDFGLLAGSVKLEAKTVINASGRWSNLSHATKPAGKGWIGLKAHFTESRPPSSVDLYFFNGGYCGVQRVGEHTINACAMVCADVAADLNAVFAQHSALRERSQAWEQVSATVATAPLMFGMPHATRDGVLLAGDAAGFIDPFLGDGISLALRSGAWAGEGLGAACAGLLTLEEAVYRYDQAYRRDLAPAFSRAARLRRVIGASRALRTPLLKLANLPGVSELVFRKTRPRHTATAAGYFTTSTSRM